MTGILSSLSLQTTNRNSILIIDGVCENFRFKNTLNYKFYQRDIYKILKGLGFEKFKVILISQITC